jgi:signal peptidase II
MLWIIVVALVVLLDQVSKYIIIKNVEINEMIQVINKFFYITHYKNPGAAWGMLKNGTLLFLIVIPVIAIVLLFVMMKNKHSFLRFSLSLVLGGAIGNYIDRIVIGRVTDFLLFYIGSYPFPIFNVADIAITCGTILLAIYLLFIYKEPKSTEPDKDITSEENR